MVRAVFFFFLFSPASCDSTDGALAGRWFFVVVIESVVFGTPRDVVETIRKLYLVTVVAFFATGSMMQLMMSVLVSISAFSYHVYARPFLEDWLNSTSVAFTRCN